MKAFIFKDRIRVSPVPKEEGWQLSVWLKKPLTEHHKPFVQADVNPGQKFYSLPCSQDNIYEVIITKK